ncbi:MAG: cytochrome c oxidase subunit II [Candidatus Omnitrophica bacterium]|nr:cytochrome c oxidase subunit II [Candidatus Omnitrophota bacterium]
MIELLHKLGLPLNASAHGGEIDATLGWLHLLMFALFIGWSLVFLFILWRFRRSRNPQASYVGVKNHSISLSIEVVVALAEAGILILLSIPLWAERVNQMPTDEDRVEVRVVAQQFAWNMHYPGPDGLFGTTSPDMISQTNPIGLDRESPNAADDIVSINWLYLPKGRPAVLHLSSMDVIHSFSLPEMRVKQDCIPGMSVPIWFEPTLTTEEMRDMKVAMGDWEEDKKAFLNYEIACAQLCGLGHYQMRGFMEVMEPEAFDQWVETESAKARESGSGEEDFGEFE